MVLLKHRVLVKNIVFWIDSLYNHPFPTALMHQVPVALSQGSLGDAVS
jgi:hypothetical protein